MSKRLVEKLLSHDSVNRFLHRENYQPKGMFDEAAKSLCLVGGTLSVDDSVLDKPYSYSVALVSHFWSGKHHRVEGHQPRHPLLHRPCRSPYARKFQNMQQGRGQD